MSLNDTETFSTKLATVTYSRHLVDLSVAQMPDPRVAPGPDTPEFDEYLKRTSAMAVQCALEQGIYVPKSLLEEIAEMLNIQIPAPYGVVLPSGANSGVPNPYSTNVGYFHMAIPAVANNDKLWVVLAFKFIDGWTFVSRGFGISGHACTARRFIQLLSMLESNIAKQVNIPGMSYGPTQRPSWSEPLGGLRGHAMPGYGAHFGPYGLGRYLDNFEHHAPYGRFGEGYAPAEDVKR